MANNGDFAALERMIASCRELARLPELAAPIAARNVDAELRASASAGRAPNGTAWKPRKSDGGKPLANAAGAIAVKAIGTVVLIVLTGHHVFHHFGAGGKPKRQIIPQGSIPPKLGNAIRLGFVAPFRDIVKGKKS
ncbi:hypothetical protein [Sorangium sp. So ce131]|uniref:hypothetical protein n=1 Tax=Sorangium sp. So ce131 TaxID=3133282 RepID=UPI003F640B12